MESLSLTDKPWQLTGEVGAAIRPENSLMDQKLDFDRGVMPGEYERGEREREKRGLI